ncbi:amino acid adenylation domain-containing protein [Streptomyces flavofungini]|uniref:amino acid adenylation domain-containing protein n=1 Tax=Streptomyces flavofungini TaxID=68200 RepID=UPI0025B066C9|nr:non-ribosomal peptide synthetase [Streptomyces flavofungini]WJV44940.1 amino acid adenylation domain-containing protein [Streptomyces flavofungini]
MTTTTTTTATAAGTAAPAAEIFRAGPQQHDATGDDTVTTLVLRAPATVPQGRLAAAVAALTLRHEVLRTALVASAAGGAPTQHVFAGELPEPTGAGAGADGAAEAAPARPWSALAGPGGRIQLAASAHVLDPEGLLLLASELERELAGATTGDGTGPADGEPLQYADVAEWLHDMLAEPEAAAARANQESAHGGADAADETGDAVARVRSLAPMAGAATPSGTAAEDGRAAADSVRSFTLPADAFPAAEAEALLLAAWLVVLHRFGGAETLTVRVRTGLREVPQLQSSLGPLSAWPGLRYAFGSGRTLADVVSAVRAARAEQRESVELISDLSAVSGPLAFSYAQVPERVGGWSVESLAAVGTGPALRLAAVRHGDRVEVRLDGAAAAGLGGPVADRLLDALAAVVEQGVREPGTRIGRTVLGPAAAPLAAPVSPTAADWRESTLPDLIVRAAGRTPDATAVRCADRELTYRQLLSAADRLSARLDVGPEAAVAVLVPDPVARLVTQLAVLRAGAAYLVVDPADPADRIAGLLGDASVRTCVATADTAALLGESGSEGAGKGGGGVGRSLDVVVLGADDLGSVDEEAGAVAAKDGPAAPDNLAYLLFTSGSTGRPKPVAVTHRNVVNYLGWLADVGIIGPDTVLPATAAPVFDASVKQLWGPLVLGGTVVLPPAGQRPAETLAAAVSGADATTVTTVNTVPRLWDETLRALESADSTARPGESALDVLLGGEALTADLVARTYRLLPKARLWNLYGPSEATANATAGIVGADGRVSLGGPVGGTTLHVLDEALMPVAPGVIGELYVGGAGVTRGYAGRGGRTAERYPPDPFASEPGARLYRTGDLVRIGADGLPEFCGRADGQLKVRGYRVEPGEVEAVLLRHPGVRAAVVDARDSRLVAWLVPGPDGAPTVAELREHCAAVLPAYLVPGLFVALDQVPLTPQGKTDRRALPDPADGHLERGGEFTAPRTPVEMVVAEIWRTVLGVERVGAHDSFFALGGDSIRAMHTVAQVRDLMGTELPLQDLLTAPTVADQANLLLAHDQDGAVREFAEAFAALDPADDPEAPTAGPAHDVPKEQS